MTIYLTLSHVPPCFRKPDQRRSTVSCNGGHNRSNRKTAPYRENHAITRKLVFQFASKCASVMHNRLIIAVFLSDNLSVMSVKLQFDGSCKQTEVTWTIDTCGALFCEVSGTRPKRSHNIYEMNRLCCFTWLRNKGGTSETKSPDRRTVDSKAFQQRSAVRKDRKRRNCSLCTDYGFCGTMWRFFPKIMERRAKTTVT